MTKHHCVTAEKVKDEFARVQQHKTLRGAYADDKHYRFWYRRFRQEGLVPLQKAAPPRKVYMRDWRQANQSKVSVYNEKRRLQYAEIRKVYKDSLLNINS